MATSSDLWYIRLPDGRVLHARSTDAMRRYLKSGRIPWESRVRRSPDDTWQPLQQTQYHGLVARLQQSLGATTTGDPQSDRPAGLLRLRRAS